MFKQAISLQVAKCVLYSYDQGCRKSCMVLMMHGKVCAALFAEQLLLENKLMVPSLQCRHIQEM